MYTVHLDPEGLLVTRGEMRGDAEGFYMISGEPGACVKEGMLRGDTVKSLENMTQHILLLKKPSLIHFGYP